MAKRFICKHPPKRKRGGMKKKGGLHEANEKKMKSKVTNSELSND